MRLRLLALLGTCAIAGGVAAYADRVDGSQSAAAATVRHARTPARRSGFTLPRACPLPRRYGRAFVRAAVDTGLPLSLLVAVAETESGFEEAAVSPADARGLLQVLPTTAAALRLNVDAPASNVLAGARYLQMLVDRFTSADLALAAYNAGPTAVANAAGAPTAETQAYVATVDARWRLLRACDST